MISYGTGIAKSDGSAESHCAIAGLRRRESSPPNQDFPTMSCVAALDENTQQPGIFLFFAINSRSMDDERYCGVRKKHTES